MAVAEEWLSATRPGEDISMTNQYTLAERLNALHSSVATEAADRLVVLERFVTQLRSDVDLATTGNIGTAWLRGELNKLNQVNPDNAWLQAVPVQITIERDYGGMTAKVTNRHESILVAVTVSNGRTTMAPIHRTEHGERILANVLLRRAIDRQVQTFLDTGGDTSFTQYIEPDWFLSMIATYVLGIFAGRRCIMTRCADGVVTDVYSVEHLSEAAANASLKRIQEGFDDVPAANS